MCEPFEDPTSITTCHIISTTSPAHFNLFLNLSTMPQNKMQYPKYSLNEVLQLYLCALADYSVNVKKYQQSLWYKITNLSIYQK
ncbi:hypothetical protein PVAP13_J011624 [Panicum virgatum]|nr:hypothetical protein PVAP13_J011624 [Panicum virgatum]